MDPVTVRSGHASMNRMPKDRNSPGGISARLVSPSADSADPPGLNNYDTFAEAYTAPRELLPDDVADGQRLMCFLFFVLHSS